MQPKNAKATKEQTVQLNVQKIETAIGQIVDILKTGRTKGISDLYHGILSACESKVDQAIYGDVVVSLLYEHSFATSDQSRRRYFYDSFSALERGYSREELQQVIAGIPPILQRICPGAKSFAVDCATMLLRHKFHVDVG